MAKLADLARIQRLWNKIKNNFVRKDSNGNVSVTGNLTATTGTTSVGETKVYGDLLMQGNNIELMDGKEVTFKSEDNSKSASIYCADDGKLVIGGKTIATVNDVTAAVAAAPHLTREKLDALPGVATAKENVIYMIPRTTAEDENVYDEYMFFKTTGTFEKMGSSEVDLSGYSTTEQMNSAINTAVSNSYTLITDAEIDALT